MTDETRPYRMQRRAESQEQTRLRITESAVELHGTLGPVADVDQRRRGARGRAALDGLSPLPRRGGAVRRLHGHWAAANPPPDLARLGGDRRSRRAAARRAARALRLLRPTERDARQPLPRRADGAARRASDSPRSAATSTAARDALMAGRGAARRARAAYASRASATPSRSRPGSRSCASRGSRTRTQARSCAPWWPRPDRSAGKGVADRLGGRRLEPDVGRQRREDGVARLVLAVGAGRARP